MNGILFTSPLPYMRATADRDSSSITTKPYEVHEQRHQFATRLSWFYRDYNITHTHETHLPIHRIRCQNRGTPGLLTSTSRKQPDARRPDPPRHRTPKYTFIPTGEILNDIDLALPQPTHRP